MSISVFIMGLDCFFVDVVVADKYLGSGDLSELINERLISSDLAAPQHQRADLPFGYVGGMAK